MADRKNVKDILGKTTQMAPFGPGEETVVFSSLAASDFPAALRSSFLVGFSALVTAVLALVAAAYWSELQGTIWQLAAVVGISSIPLWGLSRLLVQRREIRAHAEELLTSVEQLRSIAERLRAYRTDFDLRTRRYFHAVTSDKIQSYFILNQLQESLDHRIEALDLLLQKFSRRSVVAAHRLLHGEIKFADGHTSTQGLRRSVPLNLLELTLTEIIENLEVGVAQMEKQIMQAEQLQGQLTREVPLEDPRKRTVDDDDYGD